MYENKQNETRNQTRNRSFSSFLFSRITTRQKHLLIFKTKQNENNQ